MCFIELLEWLLLFILFYFIIFIILFFGGVIIIIVIIELNKAALKLLGNCVSVIPLQKEQNTLLVFMQRRTLNMRQESLFCTKNNKLNQFYSKWITTSANENEIFFQ